MKKTKSIFLFLLLVFPVLIYLFLQAFGTNHFEIPVYYENGLTDSMGDCSPASDHAPYRLDRLAITQLLEAYDNKKEKIIVYEIGNQDTDLLRNNLYTFLEKYKENNEVELVSVKMERDTLFSQSRYNAWHRFNLTDSNLLRLGRCILRLELDANLKADSGLVLVDKQRQIRGYYDPLELKEIDRLNTELYILLSE